MQVQDFQPVQPASTLENPLENCSLEELFAQADAAFARSEAAIERGEAAKAAFQATLAEIKAEGLV